MVQKFIKYGMGLLMVILFISADVSKSALDHPKMDAQMVVKDFDADLLERAIVELINEKRKKKGVDSLIFQDGLQKSAAYFQSKLEFRRFKYPEKIERKIDRDLQKMTKKYGYEGGLTLPVVAMHQGINYKAGEAFFYDGSKKEAFKLFYGEKPRKDDSSLREEIPAYTYREFAHALIKNLESPNKKQLYAKVYTKVGVDLSWYYKTLNRRRIPQVKMILVLGGFQTAGMWE